MRTIEGLAELQAQLDKLAGIKTPEAMLKGAKVLQKASMRNSPVKTGFLRQSHESVKTDDGAEMRVNAEYAAYVEFGTSSMAARGYVRSAIDSEAEAIVAAVAKEIEKEIQKAAQKR